MKKIGVYFGTFAPMHIGHLHQVYKAAFENDEVLLVASGFDDDRGAKIGLDLNRRVSALTEFFSDESHIHVVKLDENDLPPMPDGWDEWTSRLLEFVHSIAEGEIFKATFYVGEEEYVTELRKRFPLNENTYLAKIADRSNIPISATQIRSQPQKNWEKIIPTFQPYFVKRVKIKTVNADLLILRLNKLFANSGVQFVSTATPIYDLELECHQRQLLQDFYTIIDQVNKIYDLEVLRLK